MGFNQKLTLSVAVLLFINQSSCLNNGLGKTPAMGWNTWNKYNCDISEDIIKQNAKKIVDLGLDKIGYVYINIDDCWQLADRDANGNVQADLTKFPNGMMAVGDYIHTLGLKFGIYSSAGTQTCQGKAGSLGFEKQDAQYYSNIGADYLKYDNCFNQGVQGKKRYTDMRDALNSTGRPIYYSICSWGTENIWEWGAETGNSWRTTLDIENFWASVKFNFNFNAQLADYSGSGSWNDPDMLEIGNNNLTIFEEKSHFALWCFLKAPLILGNDLVNMGPEVLAIISNQYLIDVNQNSVAQARCIMNCQQKSQVYHTQVHGNYPYDAILVMNWDNKEKSSVMIDFMTLGLAQYAYDKCDVFDMWAGSLIGTYQGRYFVNNVLPHNNVALKIQCKSFTAKDFLTSKSLLQ
ncbi:melibiase family protein [Stylonychia lemnae]|uniref:Alpha-galactosidase n=1 Tax=Stylonychia lemnae TaxID=5949 RepID=A0A078AA62_STYLE|nr:melibiase family protein [Stylonychia lemnae]|eukprot:CDW77703.1 melibiase family protein [Stylonychia lemnae]